MREINKDDLLLELNKVHMWLDDTQCNCYCITQHDSEAECDCGKIECFKIVEDILIEFNVPEIEI